MALDIKAKSQYLSLVQTAAKPHYKNLSVASPTALLHISANWIFSDSTGSLKLHTRG